MPARAQGLQATRCSREAHLLGLLSQKRKGGGKEPVADGRRKKGRILALDARFPVVVWLPAESIPKKWPRV